MTGELVKNWIQAEGEFIVAQQIVQTVVCIARSVEQASRAPAEHSSDCEWYAISESDGDHHWVVSQRSGSSIDISGELFKPYQKIALWLVASASHSAAAATAYQTMKKGRDNG